MMTTGFDIAGFQAAVERHWNYHSKCRTLSWAHVERDDGYCQIEAAPAFQEIFGGADDGKKVWSGFEINLTAFFAEPGMAVEEFGALSYCESYSTTPAILMSGKFRGQRFVMTLMLEPVPGSEPIEIVDTIKAEIRTIKETHHE